jgi:hypothetical protein
MPAGWSGARLGRGSRGRAPGGLSVLVSVGWVDGTVELGGAASLRSRPAANQRAAADLAQANSTSARWERGAGGHSAACRRATAAASPRAMANWGQAAVAAVGAVDMVVLAFCWLGPALGSDVHGSAVDAQGRRYRAGAGTRPRPLPGPAQPGRVGAPERSPLASDGPPNGQVGPWHAAAQPRWPARRRCGSRRSGRRGAWLGKDRVVGAANARPRMRIAPGVTRQYGLVCKAELSLFARGCYGPRQAELWKTDDRATPPCWTAPDRRRRVGSPGPAGNGQRASRPSPGVSGLMLSGGCWAAWTAARTVG